jgi:hypothetical protein
MAGVPGWPTLSQLKALTFDHLGLFADWCDDIPVKAEKALERLARDVRAPGGVEWEGQAADAAITQAKMDVVKARPLLWSLPDAASAARRGQDTLQAAQRLALDAVDDAERDGFQVGEDYSVRDTQQAGTGEQLGQRQAQAEAHANFIRHRVGHLVAHDQTITGQLKTASEGWGKLTFEESPRTTDEKKGRVQAVGHTWKQGPDQPGPPHGPSADDIRRVLDKLPQGNQPWIREVRSPQDLQNLWNWMTQNGVDNPNRYGDAAKGVWKDLPDGIGVGQRDAAASTGHPALDIRVPGENGYTKVHINPERGGVPEIPAPARPAPFEPPVRPPGPTEGAPADPHPAEPPARPGPAPPSAAPPRVDPARVEPPVPRPAPPRPGFGGFGGGSIGGGGGGPLPGQHGSIWEPTE